MLPKESIIRSNPVLEKGERTLEEEDKLLAPLKPRPEGPSKEIRTGQFDKKNRVSLQQS